MNNKKVTTMSERSGILAAILLATMPAVAAETPGGSEAERIAAELANPLAPITTLVGQYRAEFGNGPDDDVNHQLRLQPSLFKPNADQSAFLLRSIIPYAMRTWPADESGLGDIIWVPYFVPDVTKTTFIGYGATIGLPTATEDNLGTGKWTAGPAMIVAKAGGPITFGGLLQHVWSYAGAGDRSDVSATTIQPTVSGF